MVFLNKFRNTDQLEVEFFLIIFITFVVYVSQTITGYFKCVNVFKVCDFEMRFPA